MLYIFEVANNHQGNVSHGLNIIREMGALARKHKINGAVKFQYRDLDTFIHKDAEPVGHIKRFQETRLNDSAFKILVDAVKQEGLTTVCTPFDEASVGKIVRHGIDVIKVASCSAHDWPLLEEIAKAGKPVIISTGGRSIYDIDKIYNFFTHRKVQFSILHCVSEYPAKWFDMCFIDKMKRRYSVPIGYSGHEAPDNLLPGQIAVAKGAEILERHVGIGDLNKYSMTPEQVDAWLTATKAAKEVCGSEDKRVSVTEQNSLKSLKRGVYAKDYIREGERLGDNVYFAMPCMGMSADEYSPDTIATQHYAKDAPICEQRPEELSREVRHYIHDCKGLIHEANIHLGQDYSVELSHHYGLDKFRDVGAFIINLINREYCKKLIVMLPGQRHPTHHHKKKEETFQILHGDLRVILDGTVRVLKPGDLLLVERGKDHSFMTDKGCIFEEVSTTHYKGDSYYRDEKIARVDPIRRKTVLDSI